MGQFAEEVFRRVYNKVLGVDEKDRNYWQQPLEYQKKSDVYNLGLSYLNGKGVAKDIAKAKSHFKKAATQGHKDANRKLLEHEMAENNWTTADEWNRLGVKYHDGNNGYVKDYISTLEREALNKFAYILHLETNTNDEMLGSQGRSLVTCLSEAMDAHRTAMRENNSDDNDDAEWDDKKEQSATPAAANNF